MHLLVVYGLKTTDYGWLEEFYPAQRLKEICKNRGIELRFLFPQDVTLFLTKAPRNFLPESTPCLIRGLCPISTVVLLENSGYTCYNSSHALKRANDKLSTYDFLIRHKYPTPHTALFHSKAFLQSDSKLPVDCNFPVEWDYPFVLKPRNGSRGKAVHLVSSKKELETIIDTDKDFDEWIIQTYIEKSRGKDLRIFFIQNTVIASVVRFGPQGDFRSNACNGGRIILADRSSPSILAAETMALEIARLAGLYYGTVDFLFCDSDGNSEFTVGEINASPGYEALEKHCGFNIVESLIETIFPATSRLTTT